MKIKYEFRVVGWKISITNIKALEKWAKEYDERVKEWEDYCHEHVMNKLS